MKGQDQKSNQLALVPASSSSSSSRVANALSSPNRAGSSSGNNASNTNLQKNDSKLAIFGANIGLGAITGKIMNKFSNTPEQSAEITISGPTNAVHVGHMGINKDTGEFQTRNLPVEWQTVFLGLNETLAKMGAQSIRKEEATMLLKRMSLAPQRGPINLSNQQAKPGPPLPTRSANPPPTPAKTGVSPSSPQHKPLPTPNAQASLPPPLPAAPSGPSASQINEQANQSVINKLMEEIATLKQTLADEQSQKISLESKIKDLEVELVTSKSSYTTTTPTNIPSSMDVNQLYQQLQEELHSHSIDKKTLETLQVENAHYVQSIHQLNNYSTQLNDYASQIKNDRDTVQSKLDESYNEKLTVENENRQLKLQLQSVQSQLNALMSQQPNADGTPPATAPLQSEIDALNNAFNGVYDELIARCQNYEQIKSQLEAHIRQLEDYSEEIKNWSETQANQVLNDTQERHLEEVKKLQELHQQELEKLDKLSKITVSTTPSTITTTSTTDNNKLLSDLENQIESLKQKLTHERDEFNEKLTSYNTSKQAIEMELLDCKSKLTLSEAKVKSQQSVIDASNRKISQLETDLAAALDKFINATMKSQEVQPSPTPQHQEETSTSSSSSSRPKSTANLAKIVKGIGIPIPKKRTTVQLSQSTSAPTLPSTPPTNSTPETDPQAWSDFLDSIRNNTQTKKDEEVNLDSNFSNDTQMMEMLAQAIIDRRSTVSD
eukprot:TRINITY_DN11263_c0_g1_i1.p1 TRINITY_DN11263_c0_g1~~TRINITY_DN11263_c0_g1_i1.p1  ORF type:complete len:721 (+),score=222.71 TRINITY_DN11263_c0_g1_i1:2-2164(+)